jgi:hypothetical protein
MEKTTLRSYDLYWNVGAIANSDEPAAVTTSESMANTRVRM